jgi:hypothetical protein
MFYTPAMYDYKTIPDQEIHVTKITFEGIDRIDEGNIKKLCDRIYNSSTFHSLLRNSNNFLILMNELGVFKEVKLKLEEDTDFKSTKPVPIKLTFEGAENRFSLKIGSYLLKDDPSLYFNFKVFNIGSRPNSIYFNASKGMSNNQPFELLFNFPFTNSLASIQLALRSKEKFGYYTQFSNRLAFTLTRFFDEKCKISFTAHIIDEIQNTSDEKLPIAIRKSLFPGLATLLGVQITKNSLDNNVLPCSGLKNDFDFSVKLGFDKPVLRLYNKFTAFQSFSFFTFSYQAVMGLTYPPSSFLASENFVSGGPSSTKAFLVNSLGQYLGKYNVGSSGLINLNFDIAIRKFFSDYLRPGVFLNSSFLTGDRSFINWDKNVSLGFFLALNFIDRIRLEIITGFPLTSPRNFHKGIQFGFLIDV